MTENNTSDNQSSERKILWRGTALVSALTMLSRVFGLARDLLTAAVFGAGIYADAFLAAYRIPNLLRSLVAEGALTSAFVPIINDEIAKDQQEARRSLEYLFGFMILLTSVITVLGIWLAPTITDLMLPGFKERPEQRELTIAMLQIMFPYVICISLVAMINGVLNSVNQFGYAATAQITMNITLMIGAALGALTNPQAGIKILAYSATAGGALQVVLLAWRLKVAGFSLRARIWLGHPAVKKLLLLMTPAIAGAGLYQVMIFLLTCFASLLPVGTVTWLSYADRLAQLPMGIFTIALGSVLLPILSRQEAREDHGAAQDSLLMALRYTSVLIIPFAAYLGCSAQYLISIGLERAKFTAFDSMMTAQALQGFALGLWGMSCHSLIVRAFLAQKDTKTPVTASVISLCLTFLCAIVLIGPIAVTPDSGLLVQSFAAAQSALSKIIPTLALGHVGLALTSGLATTFAFFYLTFRLRQRRPNLALGPFLLVTLKSVLITAVAILVMNYQSQILPGRWLPAIVQLFTIITITLLGGWILKIKETERVSAAVARVISQRVLKKRLG